MVRLSILADDFTGACDAAAGLAPAVVVLDWRAGVVAHEDADVVAYDLDLRERSDADAEPATEAAVASVVRSHGSDWRLLLKVDSTLRGPLAGLVEGALRGSGADVAVIAPAFPEQSRLLEGGRLMVHGQVGANLTARLGLEGTALLGAPFARSAADVERAVAYARGRGMRRVVVDADGPTSLASVAEAWVTHPEWLVVGSAGLTRRLGRTAPRHVASDPPAVPAGPILVVAGSPTATTRTQLAHLEKARVEDVVVLATPPGMRAERDTRDRDPADHDTGERDAGQAAAALADMVGAWATETRPRGLVLAGGATARLVCERLGVRAVWLAAEVSPGIPIGALRGGAWDGVPVVTKAGAFGAPDALLQAVRALGASASDGDR